MIAFVKHVTALDRVARKIAFVLALLLVAICAGCEPMTGVIRTVTLTNAPSNQAIEAALRDVPGSKSFDYEGSDTWSTRNGRLVLQVRQIKKGPWILEMRRVSFGHSTLEQLQEPRRLMDEVYESLRKQSPNLPPQTEVREKLIGLKTK